MNIEAVEKIANAVLYEGYILYPYRPSAIKNQHRFNFGVLYPQEYGEAWEMRTECLVEGSAKSTIEVKIRFLQMAQANSWQEGIEREISVPAGWFDLLFRQRFSFEATEKVEVEVELGAREIEPELFKVTLVIRNVGALENTDRNLVLLRSLVSVHSILHCVDGEFISLLDPPEHFKDVVAGCQNAGTFPVLAGDPGQRDMMLSSPIILYDYPEIAPESPGDLCDGLEIDEILALRILTLTDAEKQEVREGDDRARKILERTEMLPPEHFQKLHGALRSVR